MSDLASVATSAARAIIAASQGDAMGAAAHGLEAVLEAVPHDVAQKMLSDAAIRRARAAADAEEDRRFDP
jgi:hypothetical protein